MGWDGEWGKPRFKAVRFQTSGMGVGWKYGTIPERHSVQMQIEPVSSKFTSPRRLLRLQLTGLEWRASLGHAQRSSYMSCCFKSTRLMHLSSLTLLCACRLSESPAEAVVAPFIKGRIVILVLEILLEAHFHP